MMSAIGFSRQAKIPLAEAESHFNEFERRYFGIGVLRQNLFAHVRMNNGQVNNLWGRTRRVPNIMASGDENRQIRRRAERMIIAALIQGTAAELTKESFVRLDHWKQEEGLSFDFSMTIHDEISLDIPPDEFAFTVQGAKACMTDYPEFHPIPVEVGLEYTITNWAEKKPIPGF